MPRGFGSFIFQGFIMLLADSPRFAEFWEFHSCTGSRLSPGNWMGLPSWSARGCTTGAITCARASPLGLRAMLLLCIRSACTRALERFRVARGGTQRRHESLCAGSAGTKGA